MATFCLLLWLDNDDVMKNSIYFESELNFHQCAEVLLDVLGMAFAAEAQPLMFESIYIYFF